MGNAIAMLVLAVPLTIFNIYRESLRTSQDNGEDPNAHRYNPAFAHLYPPPPINKLNTQSNKPTLRRPNKSYVLYTQNGRTTHYPVDPFFMGLKVSSLKTRIPKFNIETVFEESGYLLKGRFNDTSKKSENVQSHSDEEEEFQDAQDFDDQQYSLPSENSVNGHNGAGDCVSCM